MYHTISLYVYSMNDHDDAVLHTHVCTCLYLLFFIFEVFLKFMYFYITYASFYKYNLKLNSTRLILPNPTRHLYIQYEFVFLEIWLFSALVAASVGLKFRSI